MDRGWEANALQGCEEKRSEADMKNLAEEVKSRKSLKDQCLIIEEKETLLSYLDKLSAGENCEGQGDVVQTYDKIVKQSQEAAVPEVFFDEKEIRDVE